MAFIIHLQCGCLWLPEAEAEDLEWIINLIVTWIDRFIEAAAEVDK